MIKQILPYGLVEFLKKKNRPRAQFFDSYEQARKACKTSYDFDSLAQVVAEKTRIFRDSLKAKPVKGDLQLVRCLATMFASPGKEELKILDFGGACGAHYFTLKSLLRDRIKLNWAVVETDSMVNHAKALETEELSFFSSVNQARNALGQIDLLFSSGTLQYLESPTNLIEQLMAVEAEFVYLTRMGLSQDQKVITIQESSLGTNGPGPLPPGFTDKLIDYPVSFIPKSELSNLLTQKYEILCEIHESVADYQFQNLEIDMFGYFCQRLN